MWYVGGTKDLSGMAKKNNKNNLAAENSKDVGIAASNTNGAVIAAGYSNGAGIAAKIDSINDINSAAELTENELAIVRRISAKIGIGVENYLFAIKDALGATKRSVDKSGAESIDIDHVTRLKAAEMGMNFEGYSSAKIANNVVDNRKYTQVIYKYEGF